MIEEANELINEHQQVIFKSGKLVEELKSFNYTEEQKEILEEEFNIDIDFFIEELEMINW